MSHFEVIPAIDLIKGQVVRLRQGSFDQATIYNTNPASVAKEFAKHNIQRIHVVDLDGAKGGRPQNDETIKSIIQAAPGVRIQTGGGVRNLGHVEQRLELGIDRVILGTSALNNPSFVRKAASLFPGRIAVGVDARDGLVSVEGWLETSDVRAVDLVKKFEDAGICAVIYTDISRDGMSSGPNIEQTELIAAQFEIPVIASGGVGSLNDILRAVPAVERGVSGIIVGRALYSGALDLKKVLKSVEAAHC